jgi:hypothetical protein
MTGTPLRLAAVAFLLTGISVWQLRSSDKVKRVRLL